MNARFRRLSSPVFALVLTICSGLRAGSFVLDPPSPSWPDSNDILRDRPGPVSALPRLGISAASLGLQAQDVIDALSDGRDPVDGEKHPGDMHLIFSVSRQSAGLPGTAVRQERIADTVPPAGAQPNGHASDLFVWDGVNGVNALAPALLGWSLGSQTGDEANAHLLVPGGGQPGDDVNGYDRGTLRFLSPAEMGDDGPGGGPAFPPSPIFFSLRIGSPTLAAIGATGGDVLAVGGPFGPNPVIFIPHAALALPAWIDLDALNLEVRKNAAGALVPHRVRFSVSSATLGFALPNGQVVGSGAHVLTSDGVNTIIAHPAGQLGLRVEDDLDALESVVTQGGIDVGEGWVFEPLGDAALQPGPTELGLSVSQIGTSGTDGVAIELPPTLELDARLAMAEGSVRVQPVTPYDGADAQFLLPYIEQDNVLHRIRIGLAASGANGAGEGGGGADVLMRLASVVGWRGEEKVFESTKDSLAELGEEQQLRLQLGLTQANGIIAILIGLLAAEGTNSGSFQMVYDFRTSGNSLVVMPDPGFLADRVVVTFESRGEMAGAVSLRRGLALSGLGITAIDSVEDDPSVVDLGLQILHTRRGLLFGGHPHAALGQAIIGESIEGEVEVANLGASGADGVQVGLQEKMQNENRALLSITPDQKTIIGGALANDFNARFGLRFAPTAQGEPRKPIELAIEKVDIANEKIERVLAFGFVASDPDNGDVALGAEGDGGGAGLLSSPLGFFATESLPARILLGRRGVELVFVEEVSFVPADGSPERRGKRLAFNNLWDSSAELEQVEIRAAGISAFRLDPTEESALPIFRRGDSDGSSQVQLSDAIATLNSLFLGTFDLQCLDAADSNDDGQVTIADAITTLGALFLGHVTIPPPGTDACGVDPTEDSLGCESQSACE